MNREHVKGTYDFHTAANAETPHVAVYRYEDDEDGGKQTRIADVYIHDRNVDEAENTAMFFVRNLNSRDRVARESKLGLVETFADKTEWARESVMNGTVSVNDRLLIWEQYDKLMDQAKQIEPMPSKPMLMLLELYGNLVHTYEYDIAVFNAKKQLAKYYGLLDKKQRLAVQLIWSEANEQIEAIFRKNLEWAAWATKEITEAAEYRLKGIADAVVMPWVESERGWGVRPDGFSVHRTTDDLNKFISDFNDSIPDEVPDTYSRPEGPVTTVMMTAHINNMIGWGSGVFFDSMNDLKDPMLDKE